MRKSRSALILLSVIAFLACFNAKQVTSTNFKVEKTSYNALQNVIADSKSDFSGVQGQKGWFYGY